MYWGRIPTTLNYSYNNPTIVTVEEFNVPIGHTSSRYISNKDGRDIVQMFNFNELVDVIIYFYRSISYGSTVKFKLIFECDITDDDFLSFIDEMNKNGNEYYTNCFFKYFELDDKMKKLVEKYRLLFKWKE